MSSHTNLSISDEDYESTTSNINSSAGRDKSQTLGQSVCRKRKSIESDESREDINSSEISFRMLLCFYLFLRYLNMNIK
jgi:hypothetical protein